MIYTDGEQGLRLHHGLDYSCPRIEQKPVPLSYPAALLTGGKLLCYYGGWPENLRLESLVQEAEPEAGRRNIPSAVAELLKGLSSLGDAEVAMTYHHGGLVDYRRKLYELHYQKGDDTVVQDYREALAAAVELLAAKGVEQYILEEMDLAYYLTGGPLQPRAIPVWAIRISGRELILEASELIPRSGKNNLSRAKTLLICAFGIKPLALLSPFRGDPEAYVAVSAAELRQCKAARRLRLSAETKAIVLSGKALS